MVPTVEIDEKTKSQLEEMQNKIKLKTGIKPTKQEILSQLVESALSKSAFAESFREQKTTLSEAEIKQFNQGTIASGVETTEDDVDDTLYG